MGFTRRAALALAGALGLAGCSAPAAETAETDSDSEEAMTDRTPRYFNRDGELTSPVNNESVSTGELNNIVFPEKFGAVGDGQTDDTQAIQDAIDSVGSGETAALWFSAGKTYYVTDSITVPLNRIRAINGNNAYIRIDSDITALDLQGDSTGKSFPDNDFNTVKHEEVFTPVTGLQIYSTTSPSSGTGIQYSNTFGLRITGNHLFDLGTAIRASDMDRNTWIDNNHIYHNSECGIHFDSTHNVHQLLMANNYIFYNDVGIYSTGGELMDWVLHSNQFEVGSQDAGPTHIVHIEDTACRGNRLINNEFQDHTSLSDSAVKIDITASDNERWSIRDNDFRALGSSGTPVHALEVLGGGQYKIEGNTFSQIHDTPIILSGLRTGGAASARTTVRDNEFWNTHGICDISGSGDMLRPIIIAGNSQLSTIVPTSPLIGVDTAQTETIRNLRVEDNDVLVGSVSYESGNIWLVDIGGDSLASCHISRNQVYCDGDFSALRVSPASSTEQTIIKDNIGRGSAGSDFDFPDDTPDDVIVKDNLTF